MKMGNKEVPKNIKSALQPRRPDVFAANTDFMQVKGKIAIVNFYEQVPTRMSELVGPFSVFTISTKTFSDSLQVVDNDSAVFDSEHSENIPLARDHHHLVRFSSPDDDAYHTVSQTLKRKVTQLLHEVAQSAHNGKAPKPLDECSLTGRHSGYSQKMMRGKMQFRTPNYILLTPDQHVSKAWGIHSCHPATATPRKSTRRHLGGFGSLTTSFHGSWRQVQDYSP